MSGEETRVLGSIFVQALGGHRVTPGRLALTLGLQPREMDERLRTLKKRGLVILGENEVALTVKGRRRIRVVFVGGGFEVIHAGHLHTLKEAKSLGDVLVAIVARDDTIRRRKGREPVSPENERLELLSSVRQVDAALLGVKGNIYAMLERVKPDVVALGYDQYHIESDVAKEASKRGLKVQVVRLGSPNPSLKTTKLLQEF